MVTVWSAAQACASEYDGGADVGSAAGAADEMTDDCAAVELAGLPQALRASAATTVLATRVDTVRRRTMRSPFPECEVLAAVNGPRQGRYTPQVREGSRRPVNGSGRAVAAKRDARVRLSGIARSRRHIDALGDQGDDTNPSRGRGNHALADAVPQRTRDPLISAGLRGDPRHRRGAGQHLAIGKSGWCRRGRRLPADEWINGPAADTRACQARCRRDKTRHGTAAGHSRTPLGFSDGRIRLRRGGSTRMVKSDRGPSTWSRSSSPMAMTNRDVAEPLFLSSHSIEM